MTTSTRTFEIQRCLSPLPGSKLSRQAGLTGEWLSLPKAVVVFWATILLTFAATMLLAAWGARTNRPQTSWDPLSDPFLGDMMEYPGTYQLLHQRAFFDNKTATALPGYMFSAVAYPPFAAAVLAFLYLAVSPVWGFCCLAAVWTVVAFWQARKLLARNGMSAAASTLLLLSLLTTSFPIARLLHQGNIELVVWIFAATGTWAFLQGRHTTAAGLWALAGAMKLYPLLYLVLLWPRRKWGHLLFGFAVWSGVSWASLLWIGPTVPIAWNGSLHNVFGYQNLRAGEWSLRELVANHSWFGWIKLLAEIMHIRSDKLLLPYSCLAAFALVWALRRLWTMPVPNQVLAVSVFLLAFPSISYFHTLVHLYVPLLVLLCTAVHARRTATPLQGIQTTLLLFVPLLTPYTLMLHPHVFLFSGLLQALALLILFCCALRYPFPGFAAAVRE